MTDASTRRAGDVGLVGAGVGPDGAADGARDGQPELEAGEARLACHGRRLGHRQAGVRHQIVALDAHALGADEDDQAADAGVADDQVGAAAEEEDGQLTRSREADQAAQLEQVVDVAKRSAGPPTRMVVKRASGSRRDVLTPMRRWMSVPRAWASASANRRPAEVAVMAAPRRSR